MKLSKFKQMFHCDTVRISQPLGEKMFLIIGFNRNTKDDSGQWIRNGQPYDFKYVAEQVIASGDNDRDLLESAMSYKRLSKMSWEKHFDQILKELNI